MSYHFSKTIDLPFDQAVARVAEALKREGFGVLTDIDVSATLKSKPLAHLALELEEKIGTMLPCNVIVQEHGAGNVEVSAVDPAASMQSISNPALAEVAEEVRGRLQKMVDGL